MGRDVKGRNLGKGITQRSSDKRYMASFVDSQGKRRTKTFSDLNQTRQWLAEARLDDSRNSLVIDEGITVNEWFDKWIAEKEKVLRFNTVRNYKERYNRNIKKRLGRMRMIDLRPIHCQSVLNDMAKEGYSLGTVKQTLMCMISFLTYAADNDVIRKSPISRSSVQLPSNLPKKEIEFFTLDEEKRFLETAKDYSYYEQFRFILETGLRVGELIGLEWKNVDLNERIIYIRKTLEYRHSVGEWVWGLPKTRKSVRAVKLTETAYEILVHVKNHSYLKKSTPEEFRDLVFLNKRTGLPTKNSTYDTALAKACDRIGVKRLSMHDLRHTMATRFCEISGNYKYLSETLGHSSIKITMDRYVHLTELSRENEMEKYSRYRADNFNVSY
ncbi:MAG: tyrosine-type recombinase/integrase [Lachnospiraceae bacterium]|nr:tyrosine-type recombinase/integrase [Lachnospiraceae bacterium]